MAADDSPFTDLDASREYSRIALVLVALLAIVVAASALPVLAPGGTQSPIASMVPVPGDSSGGSGAPTGEAGSGVEGVDGAGGLGALSPGQQTTVGGDLGGENALQSMDAETHFVVRSTQPDYWRTGAYGTYTGSGWEQAGETERYDGSLETHGMQGTQVTYEVTLNRSASALPTVWQPERVSHGDTLVTNNRAVVADHPLPEGTTYSGVSHQPPSDESLLQTAGTDYPAHVEDRHTQLPASTQAALGPTTDEITADADTPYETAQAIEQWLKTNKEYSLNVSEPPDDDVASQFVHEIDAGYCEYFATSMTAMLRTQDVPARYVVGYSTGQPTGENTYTVRGMNAHAWVEVYFPEVGWVAFEPTPADERLQQYQESLDEQDVDATAVTPTPEGPPTPTPTDEANESGDETGPSTATPTTAGGGDEGNESGSNGQSDESGDDQQDGDESATEVSLNRTAAPGATVEVTVTNDGAPVSDATVLFNGDSIGTTGPDGTVVGEVPYSEELSVTIVEPGSNSLAGPPPVPGDGDRLFRVDGPVTDTSTTYPLATNATVTTSGDAVTGNTVTVTAVVDDVPVREGNVSVDGEQVARTDQRGQAEVTLPGEPGAVSITVDRGPVSGNQTLELEALGVTTSPTAPLALPFTGATVNATLGDEPAANATVTLDGERVATTGVDGTATVQFPFESGATIGVERHGQQASVTHDGLLWNLGGVAVAALALLGAVAVVARRYGIDPRRAPHWAWLAGQTVVAGVVALGSGADAALSRFVERARLTVGHLRALLDGRRSPGELLAALRAWFRARAAAVRAPLESGVSSAVPATASGPGESDAHATLREGWTRFLNAVSVRQPHRHTPGDIATHAVVVDELPEAEVRTVVESFRAVEYGQRDPGERAPDVERAVETIEERREPDRDPTADGTRDGATGDGASRTATSDDTPTGDEPSGDTTTGDESSGDDSPENANAGVAD